uniref:E3 ubiquitin-protein ligase n=1 Tax=Paramormyrops kingsleyae TaxID=1676925 RepID=A0A3B3QQ54_9TELE
MAQRLITRTIANELAEFGTSLGADSGTTCTICMGEIVERTTLDKCGHSFCRTCLDQAFQVKQVCPVCRMVYGHMMVEPSPIYSKLQHFIH